MVAPETFLYDHDDSASVKAILYNAGRHRAESVEVVVTALRRSEQSERPRLEIAGGPQQARVRASDGFVTSVAADSRVGSS
jgi:hypothetical protein